MRLCRNWRVLVVKGLHYLADFKILYKVCRHIVNSWLSDGNRWLLSCAQLFTGYDVVNLDVKERLYGYLGFGNDTRP